MSQDLKPIDGGSITPKVTTSTLPGIYISEQYQSALGLSPRPTEWDSGRPIYDRLPSASERYKVDFGSDGNSAYVYLPVGKSLSGPDSLGVSSSNEGKFIVIKSGSIVWKYGEVTVDPVIINVENIGFSNSRYLLAYRMYLDDSPFDANYSVEDYNLRGYPLRVTSNTDSVVGWRYKPQYAFYGESPYEWRNSDGVFPGYTGSAQLSWSFPKPATLSKITLRCSPSVKVYGTATLYLSSDLPNNTDAIYPENPSFQEVVTVDIQSDSEGQFFTFNLPEPSPMTSWSVSWSDSNVAISNILVTGIISVKRKPAEALSRVSLVAYPRTSLPPTVKDSYGNDVPAIYCKLSYVDINESYVVTKVSDLREIVNTPYQPIAEWLTRPWDNNLSEIHTQVSNFSSQWMDPTLSLKHEYLDFTEKFSIEPL